MTVLLLLVIVVAAMVFNTRINQLQLDFTRTIDGLKKKIEELEGKASVSTAPLIKAKNVESDHSPQVSSELLIEQVPSEIPPVFYPQTESISPVIEEQEEFHHRVEIPNVPGPMDVLFSKIKNYFTKGNTLVKVGVVLIFFGVSFFLKYAIENDMIPIEVRMIASVLMSLAIMKVGWNLRTKNRDYSMVMQGGGIGLLVLITFISFKVYALISAPLAFILLVGFVSATAYLAVIQDSVNLALFGLVGGFMAPIMVSTGEGNHLVLFSYYTILNLAVVYISWKKAWRSLTLAGFFFTFTISGIWGHLNYDPELYLFTQPFVIIFFLIYIAVPLLFANRSLPERIGHIDGSIVFGNSIFSLLFQLRLVGDMHYGRAFSALAFSAFYIFLSRYLLKHKKENFRLLSESFIAIGVIFLTLSISLAFDGMKTSAIWAFEAAGFYWFALRQNQTLPRYFALGLLNLAALIFFFGPKRGGSELLFLNTFFMSCILITTSYYLISFLSKKYQEKLPENEHVFSNIFFFLGTLWWVIGGIYEITDYQDWVFSNSLYGQHAYLTAGLAILYLIGKKFEWNSPRLLGQGQLAVLGIFLVFILSESDHPFQNWQGIIWPLSFGVYYWILYHNDRCFSKTHSRLTRFGHAGGLWVLITLLCTEAYWLGETYAAESSAWKLAAQALVPLIFIWFVIEKKHILRWPLLQEHRTYMFWGLTPVVFCVWIWTMVTNFMHGGSAEPLPYLPFLNPLEIAQIGGFFMISLWVKRVSVIEGAKSIFDDRQMHIVLSFSYFMWLNGFLSRILHNYAGVPYDFSSMFGSALVQVSFSIYWTALSIIFMVYATKKGLRKLWLTGASLLGLVVIKMFMLEISSSNRMAQVISFTCVGVLFLVVGYFSPIPPKSKTQEEPKNVT